MLGAAQHLPSPSLGTGALHSLVLRAGKRLSEEAAAHATPGPWKILQGDGNHVLSLCPVLCVCQQESTRISGKLLAEHK